MKKISLLLVVAMIVSLFVACGSSSTSTVSSPATIKAETSSNKQDATSEEKASNLMKAIATEEKDTEPEKKEITFEAFTPIDNDECKVTVKGIDPDNMWGYTIKLGIENKSADKTYMFSVSGASVNGVDADPFFATEVAPGKKANSDVSFSSSTLDEHGITDYTDIEIALRVYDSNDWSADNVANEVFHVYPYGEENATRYVREPQDSDVVLADNENVSVILVSKYNDNIWGYTLGLFIENKTDDTEIMVSVDEASVNGYMADPFFAKSVMPGKCAFTTMSWSESTFEENDITEVEEIEFQLHVYDENNWSRKPLFKDVVKIY